MENKMYTKPQFKCAICGKIFDELKDRIDCESKCFKNQEIEAKKAAEAKKKEERATREAKVNEAFDAAYKLRDEFVRDYGFYSYLRKEPVTNTLVNRDWLTLNDVFDSLL